MATHHYHWTQLIRAKSQLKPKWLKHLNGGFNKAFILFSSDNKLNWILFNNIADKAYLNLRLNPVLFATNHLGFRSVNDDSNINPHLPTFSFVSDVNIDEKQLTKTDFHLFNYTLYQDYWQWLLHQKDRNIWLFTNDINELKLYIKQLNKSKHYYPVVIYLDNKKDVQNQVLKLALKEFYLTEHTKLLTALKTKQAELNLKQTTNPITKQTKIEEQENLLKTDGDILLDELNDTLNQTKLNKINSQKTIKTKKIKDIKVSKSEIKHYFQLHSGWFDIINIKTNIKKIMNPYLGETLWNILTQKEPLTKHNSKLYWLRNKILLMMSQYYQPHNILMEKIDDDFLFNPQNSDNLSMKEELIHQFDE